MHRCTSSQNNSVSEASTQGASVDSGGSPPPHGRYDGDVNPHRSSTSMIQGTPVNNGMLSGHSFVRGGAGGLLDAILSNSYAPPGL